MDMTTMELNAVLLKELSTIATNEELLQKAIKAKELSAQEKLDKRIKRIK